MKQVLFSVLSAALLLSVVSCGDQKKRTLSEEGEKKQVSGIASHVINQTVENLREEEEDNTETPSKSLADAPTDVKELAAWLEVPFVDEDNIPLMGKDYVYEGLGDMFRFYLTGGKNNTAVDYSATHQGADCLRPAPHGAQHLPAYGRRH